MTNIQQKLHQIFTQSYQVKRMNKQIANLRSMKEKKQIELKISLINGSSLIFYIGLSLTNKKTPSNQNTRNNTIQFSITLNKQYPERNPKIYFYGENLQYYYLFPFRNYLPLIIEWSPKYSLADIVRKVPQFMFNEQRIKQQIPFQQKQMFEIDRILSCISYQTFPIKLLRNRKLFSGMLVLNHNQILIFESTSLQAYFKSVDYILVKHVTAVLRNRTQPHRIVIEVRRKSKEYGVQFISQQQQQILGSLVEKIKLNIGSKNHIEQDNKNISQSQDSQQQEIQFFKEQKKQIGTIQQIKESIFIYESLVDNQMNSDNVSNLVILLKKAIQYYSALNDDSFKIYLKKLQELMKNQMVHVLLASKSQNNQTIQKYTSIIDM